MEEAIKKPLLADSYLDQPTDAERQYYRNLITSVNKPKTEAASKQYEQQFGKLSLSVLNSTLKKLREQQVKNQQFEIVSSMPGLSEIFGLGQSLSDSILGDTGIGGFLSMAGGTSKEQKEKLTSQLEALGGVPTKNITTYNWQKWFDETLKKEAEAAATAGIKDTKELDKAKAFAQDYVKTYLEPRFNFSKSMSEFISYVQTDTSEPEFIKEVIDREKVQKYFDELKQRRVDEYINSVTNNAKRGFDSEFYFNPSGATDKQTQYEKQAANVNAAWEAAKNGEVFSDIDWAKAAYDYGIDIKDKEQFAKLHYELYGKANQYDAAKDVVTKTDVENFINNNLIPELKNIQYDPVNGIFKNYVSPDETADGIISDLTGGKSWDQYVSDVLGIRPPQPIPSNATPEQKTKYTEDVEKYNKQIKSLREQVGENPLNDIKDQVLSFFYEQGSEGIRTRIKKLQEKNIVPTQKDLGIEYIEREIDKPTGEEKGETALYKMFKGAGYGGDEDTFYKEMFPDVSREEQQELTGLLSGEEGFKKFFDISDPFSFDPDKMFSAFDSFNKEKEEEKPFGDTYFTLNQGVGTGQKGIGTQKKQPKKTSDLYSDFEFGSFGFF